MLNLPICPLVSSSDSMSRIAYVNGRYLPFREAKVHVEDRGYQFADGVYEVCEVRGGRLIDERRHIARLQRSLGELRIPMPMSVKALGVVLREVVAQQPHRLRPRLSADHPRRGAARSRFPVAAGGAEHGGDGAAAEHEAQRGARRHAASPSSACRTTAGAASISRPSVCCPTFWRGRRPSSRARAMPGSSTKTASSWKRPRPMPGSSRQRAHWSRGTPITPSCAASRARWCSTRSKAQGLAIEERAFTLEEAFAAREAFITSATQLVLPVVKIDGRTDRRRQAGPDRERAAARVLPLRGDRIRQSQQHARPHEH